MPARARGRTISARTTRARPPCSSSAAWPHVRTSAANLLPLVHERRRREGRKGRSGEDRHRIQSLGLRWDALTFWQQQGGERRSLWGGRMSSRARLDCMDRPMKSDRCRGGGGQAREESRSLRCTGFGSTRHSLGGIPAEIARPARSLAREEEKQICTSSSALVSRRSWQARCRCAR